VRPAGSPPPRRLADPDRQLSAQDVALDDPAREAQAGEFEVSTAT
jgi:hypothetical protein